MEQKTDQADKSEIAEKNNSDEGVKSSDKRIMIEAIASDQSEPPLPSQPPALQPPSLSTPALKQSLETTGKSYRYGIDFSQTTSTPLPSHSLFNLTGLTHAQLLTLTHYLNQNGITLEEHLIDRYRDILMRQFECWLPAKFEFGETSLWGINIIHKQINNAVDNNLRGGFPLRTLIFNIFECIRVFGIHVQAENSHQYRSLNQRVSIYYGAQANVTDVMSWILKVLRWINEVILPLLIKLRASEEFLKYGLLYMLNKNYNKELDVSESSIDQSQNRARDFLNNYLKEIQGIFYNQYIFAEPVYAIEKPGFIHDLEKNITKVLELTPGTHLMACYENHDKATLIPIAVDEICELEGNRYVIKTHRNDSILMGMIMGFVFFAQQELSQSSAQKPIFDILTAFFDHPFKTKIADIINGFVFIKDLPSHRLKYVNKNMSDAKNFINIIITKLRSELANIRLANLEREVKNEVGSLDDPLWSDIMLLFWAYYDKSVSAHDLQSYICLDKTIRGRVQEAVAHIHRLEQSGVKYVIISPQTPRLTLKGLSRLIAFLMVCSKNESCISNASARKLNAITYEHTEIFSHLTLSELQEAFFYYFNAPDAFSKVNDEALFPHISDKMMQLIKMSVDHIRKYQSAGEDLIVMQAPKKTLTAAGFQILRADLSARKPRSTPDHYDAESASQMKSQDASLMNLMINSVSTLFTSVTQASSATNTINMELKPLTARSPLLSHSSTKDRTIPATQRGYGATSEIDSRMPQESPKSLFTVDPKALEDFYVTRQDVVTLGKALFNVRVVFIDKDKPKENMKEDNQLTIRLSMDNSFSVYFCFDPFHRCTNDYITQKMITLSKFISNAVLSKQQMSSIFKEFIKLGPCFDKPDSDKSIADDEIFYTKLAKNIVDKCQQNESSVADVIDLMNAMQASINASKANIKKSIIWRAWREDFMTRINFIYYFHYGKGYDQVQAINRESHCFDADKNNQAAARCKTQPG